MTPQIIYDIKSLYQRLNRHNIEIVRDVYSDDIEFIDPLHRLRGREEFERYISAMYDNVLEINFDYGSEVVADGSAFMPWVMAFRHRRLNQGATIFVEGVSHLRFNERIYYHCDYYDAGALLYEHIPLLGWAIKKVKSKVQS